MKEPEFTITYTTNEGVNSWVQNGDNVWRGFQADPQFIPEHEGYWELYDYEDYLGIMHQLLAEELGYV